MLAAIMTMQRARVMDERYGERTNARVVSRYAAVINAHITREIAIDQRKSPSVAMESRPSRKARTLEATAWPSLGEIEPRVFSVRPAIALPEARTATAKMAKATVTIRANKAVC